MPKQPKPLQPVEPAPDPRHVPAPEWRSLEEEPVSATLWNGTGRFRDFEPEMERMDLRGLRTKQFDRGGGQITAVITSGAPYHFVDSTGRLREIDSTLRPDPLRRSTLQELVASENSFETYVSAEAPRGFTIALPGGDIVVGSRTELVVASPEGQELWMEHRRAVAGELDGSRVRYHGSFPTLKAYEQITVGRSGVKSEAVLSELPVLLRAMETAIPGCSLVLRESIDLPDDWSLRLVEEAGVIEIVDHVGSLVGHMPPPVVFERTGNPQDGGDIDGLGGADAARLGGTYSLHMVQDGRYVLSAGFPAEWLVHAERQYPIVIDPQVQIDANESLGYNYTGYSLFRGCYSGYTSDILIARSGKPVDGGPENVAWLYFRTSEAFTTVPACSDITNVRLKLNIEEKNDPIVKITRLNVSPTSSCATKVDAVLSGTVYETVYEPKYALPTGFLDNEQVIQLNSTAQSDLVVQQQVVRHRALRHAHIEQPVQARVRRAGRGGGPGAVRRLHQQ
jgi:hypothetical protein